MGVLMDYYQNYQKHYLTSLLNSLFSEINEKHFNNILPQIKLGFSNRLKTTGGQYSKKPFPQIQISSRYLHFEKALDEIRDTLGHEMIHYWLDWCGKPCGHTKEFKEKLKSCQFNRYSRLTPLHARYIYKCTQCGEKYFRKKHGTWSCGPCSGKKFNPKYKLCFIATLSSEKELHFF